MKLTNTYISSFPVSSSFLNSILLFYYKSADGFMLLNNLVHIICSKKLLKDSKTCKVGQEFFGILKTVLTNKDGLLPCF